MEFNPKILGLLCNWCSYAGADLAGVSRMQYPPNIRVVRVMCSGRVDPALIVEALLLGADGVLVGGCHIGDCHYQKGNYQAEKKMIMLKKLLSKTKFGGDRVRLEWVSAAEGQRFADIIKEFTEEIRSLGPSPLGKGGDEKIRKEMMALKETVSDFRLRAIVGKELSLIEDGNVYNEKISSQRFEELMNSAIEDEFARNEILQIAKDKSVSVKDISSIIDLDPQKVLRHIVVLERKGLITQDRIEGTTPLYVAIGGGE